MPLGRSSGNPTPKAFTRDWDIASLRRRSSVEGIDPEKRLVRGVEAPHRRLGSVEVGKLHLHRLRLGRSLHINLGVLRDAVGIEDIARRQLIDLIDGAAVIAISHLLNREAIGDEVREIDEHCAVPVPEVDPGRFFSLSASAACGSKLMVTISACSPRLSRQVT